MKLCWGGEAGFKPRWCDGSEVMSWPLSHILAVDSTLKGVVWMSFLCMGISAIPPNIFLEQKTHFMATEQRHFANYYGINWSYQLQHNSEAVSLRVWWQGFSHLSWDAYLEMSPRLDRSTIAQLHGLRSEGVEKALFPLNTIPSKPLGEFAFLFFPL